MERSVVGPTIFDMRCDCFDMDRPPVPRSSPAGGPACVVCLSTWGQGQRRHLTRSAHPFPHGPPCMNGQFFLFFSFPRGYAQQVNYHYKANVSRGVIRIRIRTIRFVFVSDEIRIRIRIRIKMW